MTLKTLRTALIGTVHHLQSQAAMTNWVLGPVRTVDVPDALSGVAARAVELEGRRTGITGAVTRRHQTAKQHNSYGHRSDAEATHCQNRSGRLRQAWAPGGWVRTTRFPA